MSALMACDSAQGGDDANLLPPTRDVYCGISRVELDSVTHGRLRLTITVYESGKKMASGAELPFDRIRLSWTEGQKSVFQQDVPVVKMNAKESLEIQEIQVENIDTKKSLEIQAVASLPTVEGSFNLEAVPILNGAAPAQKASQPARDSSELAAIPVKELLRTKAAVRQARQTLQSSDIAILDGSASTPQNGSLTYRWTQIAGENLKLPASQLTRERVGLRIYKSGRYTFSLTVSDGEKTSAPAEVVIIAGDEPETKISVNSNRTALFRLTAAVLILGGVLALILRRWFRIHLSTCVAMLFAIGGLLALNSRNTILLTSESTEGAYRVASAPGWPWPLLGAPKFEAWDWKALSFDTAIFLAILAGVALGMELVFRKRKTNVAVPLFVEPQIKTAPTE